MSYLIKVDNYLDSLKTGKNAAVDRWPLMSGPVPLLAILSVYLLFVLRLGPALMRKRMPLKLTKVIQAYNVAQVILSALVCFKALRLSLFSDGILTAGCNYPGNTQDIQLSDCGWWYFFAKVTELLDTVFFVLRKKDRQVTFLHVYHHSVMAAFAWSYLKFAAGGQGAVLGLMNSVVHVVMYSYYLLAALGPAIEKYLWWKKYVTTMQMVQFVLMVSYCLYTSTVPSCNFPRGFTYFITANIVLFFVLFFSFYVKNYKKGAKPKTDVKQSHASNGCEKICNGKEINGKVNGINGLNKMQQNGLRQDCVKNGKPFLIKRTTSTVNTNNDKLSNYNQKHAP